jgi:pimeloyl-ACP methyl ester carboxylesterase
LSAVFDLVTVWQKENRAVDRAKRALWLKRREGGDDIEWFGRINLAAGAGVETAGTGDPVLLIPGWPESWIAWRNVLPLLVSAGRRVVVTRWAKRPARSSTKSRAV